jgi:DNA-binding TFAR19-related protein (PDSD5 family)
MMENDEEGQQYQKRLQRRYQEAVKRAQVERQMAEIAMRLLDANAYERLTNIKSSNPELYRQMVNVLVSLAQQNRIQGKVTEAQFKSLLEKVTQREETSIEFRHK